MLYMLSSTVSSANNCFTNEQHAGEPVPQVKTRQGHSCEDGSARILIRKDGWLERRMKGRYRCQTGTTINKHRRWTMTWQFLIRDPSLPTANPSLTPWLTWALVLNQVYRSRSFFPKSFPHNHFTCTTCGQRKRLDLNNLDNDTHLLFVTVDELFV